ncbi:hypothetical protein V6N11_068445 [Hibiscus sabdariffa]|uniref:Uncharacterized protein n=1 Tax=Hibiscus sabdariffa TaxID=183260 RepID=A0ABR1ZH43_9ROSI
MGIVEVLSSGCGRSYRCSRRRRPGLDSGGREVVTGAPRSEVVIVEATVYAAFGRRWVVAATVSSRLETLVSKRKTLWRLWSGKAGLSPSVGLSC